MANVVSSFSAVDAGFHSLHVCVSLRTPQGQGISKEAERGWISQEGRPNAVMYTGKGSNSAGRVTRG